MNQFDETTWKKRNKIEVGPIRKYRRTKVTLLNFTDGTTQTKLAF